jgi:serine/threonine protein kinase
LIAGRYLLRKTLGRGSFGTTYLANDLNLRPRTCVIKIIRPHIVNEEEIVGELDEGLLAAASVTHPCVVGISDFGRTQENLFYIVSELVEGETLFHTLRRVSRLSVVRTLGLLIQAAEGVAAAHSAGVLHLNLAPRNIFVIPRRGTSDQKNANERVKVADFGLMAALSEGKTDYNIIGTPDYVAPEQFSPAGKIDERTDIYALGTIAYQMLTGRPPFVGDLSQVLAMKISQRVAPEFDRQLPPNLERAILRALEVQQEARPATMSAWLEELRRVEASLDSQPDTDETSLEDKKSSTASNTSGAPDYDVFISYRRESDAAEARVIKANLCAQNVRAFLDVDDLRSGHFDQSLLRRIAQTPNFIVILSPTSLVRCNDEGDWLRQEIAQALMTERNIIPVLLPGFVFPERNSLPEAIKDLSTHNGLKYFHEYVNEMIARIISYLRHDPDRS